VNIPAYVLILDEYVSELDRHDSKSEQTEQVELNNNHVKANKVNNTTNAAEGVSRTATAGPNADPVVATADDTHNAYGYQQVPTGHAARWAYEAPPGYSLLDQILGPIRPAAEYQGRPVDVQTMHYQNDDVPISGNPISPSEMEESELPSIVEYEQPETTIAGFPIGAGPEGDSHAGNFESCSLRSSSVDFQSPIMKRRLSSEF
jgi:hypothetical protein